VLHCVVWVQLMSFVMGVLTRHLFAAYEERIAARATAQAEATAQAQAHTRAVRTQWVWSKPAAESKGEEVWRSFRRPKATAAASGDAFTAAISVLPLHPALALPTAAEAASAPLPLLSPDALKPISPTAAAAASATSTTTTTTTTSASSSASAPAIASDSEPRITPSTTSTVHTGLTPKAVRSHNVLVGHGANLAQARTAATSSAASTSSASSAAAAPSTDSHHRHRPPHLAQAGRSGSKQDLHTHSAAAHPSAEQQRLELAAFTQSARTRGEKQLSFTRELVGAVAPAFLSHHHPPHHHPSPSLPTVLGSPTGEPAPSTKFNQPLHKSKQSGAPRPTEI
jgi:hypothetical protein